MEKEKENHEIMLFNVYCSIMVCLNLLYFFMCFYPIFIYFYTKTNEL